MEEKVDSALVSEHFSESDNLEVEKQTIDSNNIDKKDGMWIEWDVSVTMDDGLVLKADLFRPPKEGQYPVILTYGPYAKGLPFQTGYPSCWQKMEKEHPDVTRGSTNKYQNWEVVDPEKWVPYD